MTDKRIYQIGLTMINGVGDILARHLLQALGEAEAVFTEKQQLLGRIPGIGSNIAAEIKRPEILQRAEKELAFIEKNNIFCYYLTDTDYPVRLRECPDAPIYILLEYELDSFFIDIEARDIAVAALERGLILDFYPRYKSVNPFFVHLSEVLAKRLQEFMPSMFHIMLIIGVVDHSLQVAFVVTDLVCQFKNILFHYSNTFSS